MTLAFTLIELVVVIAVIAILSAVSVAAYMGVISSARKSSDIQELTSLKTVWLTKLLANNGEGSVALSELISENSSMVLTDGSDDKSQDNNDGKSTETNTATGNYTFKLTSKNGSYELNITKPTDATAGNVAQALTVLAGDDWVSGATLGVTLDSSSSSLITAIYYARSVTIGTNNTGDWATWTLANDEVKTASAPPGIGVYSPSKS